MTTIIIRQGTTYRGLKYAHDTERNVPDELAQRMLKEGTARLAPLRDSDRADAAALAEAFRQIDAAVLTIAEVLRRNDRLNEAVPINWPLPMSAAEFAAACRAMVEHYERLAA